MARTSLILLAAAVLLTLNGGVHSLVLSPLSTSPSRQAENAPPPRYQPSIWEQQWQDNIQEWQLSTKCHLALNKQSQQLEKFKKQKCSPLHSATDIKHHVENKVKKDKVAHPWCTPPHGDTNKENIKATRDEDKQHIVFIGDSLTRYRYLDLVYRTHFDADVSPEWMINEKLFWENGGWEIFYKNTTDIFNGAMECDCFRNSNVTFEQMTENRFYVHPKTKTKLSYIQWFGYTLPLHGFFSHHIRSSLQEPEWSGNILDTVRHVISAMRPTHIVFNAGLWPGTTTTAELTTLFDAVRLIGAVPLWTETSPMQDTNRNNKTEIQYFNSNLARDILKDTFIEFPSSPKRHDYWDNLHFINSYIYKEWNNAIMKVIEKQSFIWSYYEHTNPTTGAKWRTYIEPLVGHLLRPAPHCMDQSQISDKFIPPPEKNYMLLSLRNFTIPSPSFPVSGHDNNNPPPSHLFLDSSEKALSTPLCHFRNMNHTTMLDQCVDSTILMLKNQIETARISSDVNTPPVTPKCMDTASGTWENDMHDTDVYIWMNFLDKCLNHFRVMTQKNRTPATSSSLITADLSAHVTRTDLFAYFGELRRRGVRAHTWHGVRSDET